MQNKMNWVISKLALLGGVIHIAAALSIVFLPVFTTCQSGEQGEKCYGQSYIQVGGNVLGYSLLLLMMIAGVVTIYSSFRSNFRRANMIRGLVIMASAIVIVIAGFSFGVAFVPGAFLIILATLLQPFASKQQIELQK